MKHNKTKLCAMLLGIGITAQAQQATNAVGGDASGSGGTVAYSIGQVFYTTNTNASGTVNQGVQQPHEIFTVGINKTELSISLLAFPNPTVNNLTLQIQDYHNKKLLYHLYDVQGKLLNSGQVTTQQTLINTDHLPSSTYILNITQQNKTIESFKIIKN